MSIDYTIGDDIVAVVNSFQKKFKKGNVFICKGLRESSCNCSGYEVNIGIKGSLRYGDCRICKKDWVEHSEYWWFDATMFRKLDHTFAEEVTARIEEEINQENLVEA